MYRYCVGIVVTFALFACMSGVRAVAAPGMTWTDEKAWLTNTPQVEADTITHAYDSSLGVNKASADVKMPYKLWTVSITLTKGDVVTDETFTPRKAGAGYKMQAGNGPTANLLKTLYGSNSDVAKEYA